MLQRCPASVLVLAFVFSSGCGEEELEAPDLTGDDNLGGLVTDDGSPIKGATVSIYGANPAITTTTNASGQFSLQAIDENPYILIEAPGHWGTLERVFRYQEARNDLEYELPSDAVVAEVASALGRTVLDSNGIVSAQFYSTDDPGATATIDIASDPAFAFDTNGNPVVSDTLFSGADDTELIYTNAVVGDVDVLPGSTNPSLSCTGQFDFLPERGGRVPVIAKVLSRVEIYCAPSP